MALFQKIFGKKNSLKNKKKSIEAIKLIKVANAAAVTLYIPLLDEFPKLTLISDSGLLEEFDILVTTASVGVVMTQLSSFFDPKETQQYIYSINNEISNWNPDRSKLIIQFGRYINNLTSENKINS